MRKTQLAFGGTNIISPFSNNILQRFVLINNIQITTCCSISPKPQHSLNFGHIWYWKEHVRSLFAGKRTRMRNYAIHSWPYVVQLYFSASIFFNNLDKERVWLTHYNVCECFQTRPRTLAAAFKTDAMFVILATQNSKGGFLHLLARNSRIPGAAQGKIFAAINEMREKQKHIVVAAFKI